MILYSKLRPKCKKASNLDDIFDALHGEEDLTRVRDLGVEQHVRVERLHHRVGVGAERSRGQDRKGFVGLEGRPPRQALRDVDGRGHEVVDDAHHDESTLGCRKINKLGSWPWTTRPVQMAHRINLY